MNRPSPIALALASGLALLALHGAAQAQHDHAQHHAATPAPATDAAHRPHARGTAAAEACACPPNASTDAGTAGTAGDAAMAHAGGAHAAHAPAAVDHAAMGHGPAQVTASGDVPTTDATTDHARMDHAQMDHAAMNHAQMDHGSAAREPGQAAPASASPPPPAHAEHATMGHATAHACASCACTSAAPALPRVPIPPITAADRAAAFAPLRHPMAHVPPRVGYLLFDRLEAWDTDSGSGQAWEASAWYGSDINRLWLRSEGERGGGRTEAADLEVLYGRAVSPWWDLLVGMKQDFEPGRARGSAAFGVQGMAPYKFEVAATLYLGDDDASVRLEGEYDVLLSNRLILQPRLEADVALREDRERGIGRGLGGVEAGLRLRYEVTRRFAPYVGLVHERSFGDSADYRRAEGESARDTRIVAGVRVWF
ncbi:copper resistance protein B [Xanthomonas sp. AmX2]|uniref:copper resistance protein B n=1 Tax=Xanthomonas sp. TaxID=29446 RepID=UPI00197DF00D|nr:copper resistance protein B [Xanthomonas sp.]MBN6150406.1 copper resistance protein B [Xanthomonas sp.]